jgi:AraC family transcriptional regulator
MSKESIRKASKLHSPGFKRIDLMQRSWKGIDVQCTQKYPVQGQSLGDMTSSKPYVAIRLAQRGGLSEPRLEPGEPTPRNRYDVGFFSWIPADCKVWSFTEDVHFLQELQLSFDMETLMSTLGGGFDYSCLSEPKLVIYEPRVTVCAKLLADLCADSVRDDRLFGESITVALLASVIRTVSGETGGRPSCQLAPWQLRLAKEYLEDNFSRAVSLAELARLTGLSRSWFARGFRGATGVSPYSWALRVRVQRAQELLLKSNIPLASVAVQVGFADQSHFTKVFRRLTGVTPREWKQERRPA